jgi:uncharacterized membrane protein
MFNLEQAILEWRQRMLAVGIKTPVPLEELEIHLREEIQQQMQLGLDAHKAFEISIQRIGEPKSLKGEFIKSERTFMKRTAKIGTGIIGILLGAGLMIPGSVQIRHELVMANGKLGLWLFGWVLFARSLIVLAWSFGLFQRMIQPNVLKREFEKVEMTPVKQTMKIGAGIVVLLIGIAFMMPAAAQARHEGMVELDGLCYAVFGIGLLMAGALVTFCQYKKRRV